MVNCHTDNNCAHSKLILGSILKEWLYQEKVGIKAFGVMCNCNDFLAPRPLLTQISKEVTHGVIEERVSSSTTAYTVQVNIRLLLTESAEMLQAYKVRDVYS